MNSLLNIFKTKQQNGNGNTGFSRRRRFSLPNGEGAERLERENIIRSCIVEETEPETPVDPRGRHSRHSRQQQDRRPSLAELQAEDMDRRPSITMYQSVDSQHPDVIAIQKLVDRMKFGCGETKKEAKEEEFSLEKLQSEDRLRRPSLVTYQLSDQEHPDLNLIQTGSR